MYTIEDVKKILGDDILKLSINKLKVFGKPAPISSTDENSISFISTISFFEKYLAMPERVEPAILIVPPLNGINIDNYSCSMTIIETQHPRLAFVKVMNGLFSKQLQPGIAASAIIAAGVVIPESCYIGPYVVIDSDCKIGENTSIQSHVRVYSNTVIGNNVNIMSNSVIGSDGFGYERADSGELMKFIHLGGVEIQDNVEIGSSTSIDRGALGNTIIGRGSKIDNQVHIAHNVKIGKNCLVIAQSMLGGSVVVGDNCWIAPSATVINSINIGEETTVGIGAVVIKTVNSHSVVTGNPARPLADIKKQNKLFKNLMSNFETDFSS